MPNKETSDFITRLEHASFGHHRMGHDIPFSGSDPVPNVSGFSAVGNDERPASANHTHTNQFYITTGDPSDVEASMTHPGDGTIYLDDNSKAFVAKFADGWHPIGTSAHSNASTDLPADGSTVNITTPVTLPIGQYSAKFLAVLTAVDSANVASSNVSFHGAAPITVLVGSGYISPTGSNVEFIDATAVISVTATSPIQLIASATADDGSSVHINVSVIYTSLTDHS